MEQQIMIPLYLRVKADNPEDVLEAANEYISFIMNETANAHLDLGEAKFIAAGVDNLSLTNIEGYMRGVVEELKKRK